MSRRSLRVSRLLQLSGMISAKLRNREGAKSAKEVAKLKRRQSSSRSLRDLRAFAVAFGPQAAQFEYFG